MLYIKYIVYIYINIYCKYRSSLTYDSVTS